jgi:hypothetical protein
MRGKAATHDPLAALRERSMQDPASELRRTPSRRSSEYAPLRSSGPSGEEISKATHTHSKFIGDSSGLGTNRSSEHIRALPANFWNGQICKWASAADPCGSRDKYRAPPIDLTLVGVGYPYPSAPAERAPVYAYTEEKQRAEVLRARTFAPIPQITPFANAPNDSGNTRHIRTYT